MNNNSYLPKTDEGKATFLENFSSILPTYATKYGINSVEITDMQSGALYFRQLLNFVKVLDAYTQAVTALKNEIRDGVPDNSAGNVLPILPPIPLPSAGFNGDGLFERAKSLVARIKAHNNYNKSDGEAMGIEKPASTPIDWNTAKAQITSLEAYPDEVILEWLKGKSDGVAVYSSYDSKNFVKLGTDQKSPYNDTRKNQSPNPELRFYKVRFLKNDKEVGLFSDVAKVLVDVQ